MNKKVVIAIVMVVAFFLGAIWTDYVPSIAPLVAFLELAVGFGGGYLFFKDKANEEISSCQSTIQKLLEENFKLSQKNNPHEISVENQKKRKTRKKKVAVEEQE